MSEPSNTETAPSPIQVQVQVFRNDQGIQRTQTTYATPTLTQDAARALADCLCQCGTQSGGGSGG